MNQQEILIETIQIRKGEKLLLREVDYWTDSDREILQREYYKGTSFNEMAIMLQRSEGAIYQQVERMGLCTRNPFSARKKSTDTSAPSCLCKNCKCDRSVCPRCKVYQAVLEDV